MGFIVGKNKNVNRTIIESNEFEIYVGEKKREAAAADVWLERSLEKC
jgi:hypothetical protein